MTFRTIHIGLFSQTSKTNHERLIKQNEQSLIILKYSFLDLYKHANQFQPISQIFHLQLALSVHNHNRFRSLVPDNHIIDRDTPYIASPCVS